MSDKRNEKGDPLRPDEVSIERLWEHFENAYTAVFLVDDLDHPSKIGMMKRGPNQKRFPNQYTGTGGSLEKTDEDQTAGARREWNEEIGIEGIDPKEFSRVIINGKGIIFYFFAPYAEREFPKPKPHDGVYVGEVEWVPIDEVLAKDIVPTTRYFLEEWKARNWSTKQPFTIFFEREDAQDVHSRMNSIEVREGLSLDK